MGLQFASAPKLRVTACHWLWYLCGFGLKQQNCIFSPFWRPEGQTQGVSRVVPPLKALGRVPPASASFWSSQGSPGSLARWHLTVPPTVSAFQREDWLHCIPSSDAVFLRALGVHWRVNNCEEVVNEHAWGLHKHVRRVRPRRTERGEACI